MTGESSGRVLASGNRRETHDTGTWTAKMMRDKAAGESQLILKNNSQNIDNLRVYIGQEYKKREYS